MAYIGLRKPFVARYNRSTKTYSDGFQYSHAVSMSVTPNYSEASLHGDDMQVEYEKSFNNATISLGTTSTPIQAADTMFGHEVNGNRIIYKATDEPNYVGLGVIAPEKVDGENKYVAMIIISAKFADSADTLTTKGESLTFGTPTIEGSAVADDEGNWKITETFNSEADALAYIKNYLNITSETYTITQNLTNVTSSLTGDTVEKGASLTAVLTEDTGYSLTEPTVTMGGTDITDSVWNASSNTISIASVTGNVVITATATEG